MRLLLDTHVLIWSTGNPEKVGKLGHIYTLFIL